LKDRRTFWITRYFGGQKPKPRSEMLGCHPVIQYVVLWVRGKPVCWYEYRQFFLIDRQPGGVIVHQNWLGKTDCISCETHDPSL